MPALLDQTGSAQFKVAGEDGNGLVSGDIKFIDVVTLDGRFNNICPGGVATLPNDGSKLPNGYSAEVHMRYTNTGSRAEFCFKLQTISDEPGQDPGDIIATRWDIVEAGQESVHVHWLQFGLFGAQVRVWLYAREVGGIEQKVDECITKIDTRPPDDNGPPDGPPTHSLDIHFIRLPWFDPTQLAQTIGTIADTCNPLIEPLGFHFKHVEIDLVDDVAKVYYRKTGSPAFPIVAIIAALVVLGILYVLGFAPWKVLEILLPRAKQQEITLSAIEFHENKMKLVAEGRLTDEQAEYMDEEFAKKVGIGKFPLEIVILGAAGLLIFSAVYKSKKKGRKK